ncbi:MAG: formaldehyde-activating enzyme [Alphaproteobacteria bacterium]|nr:formaldehyde-activating enzyme [Alphaproteobacteria bacterium]
MAEIIFRSGEATVFASEGQFTDAMPELVIGSVKGPVGVAFASMMGQSAGHTRMFAVRDCNQMVKPVTMMTSKVTIESEAYITLFGSVVQSATADAVLDCVIDGIIPRDQANELAIIVTIWLDPRAVTHDNLDKSELYNTNYEATKLAIKRAMNNEPSIDELIANRHKIKHCMV